MKTDPVTASRDAETKRAQRIADALAGPPECSECGALTPSIDERGRCRRCAS